MRRIAICLIASALVGLGTPAFAESTSAPLTLGEALAAAASVTGSLGVASTLDQQNGATNAAAPSPAFGLSSSVGQTPKNGAPPENTLTEQLTLNIGSRASRLGALRAAQAGTAQALATAAIARRAGAQGIVTTFFAVANDQAQLAAATTNTALAQRSLDAATQRNRVGVAPLIDVQRAQVTLATAKADVATATAAFNGDRTTLAALIGRPDVTAVAMPPANVVPDSPTATARALRTSPAVASAASGLQAARASLLTAQGQLRSGVIVGAGLQLTRQGAETSVGPALSIGLTTPFTSSLGRATLVSAQANALAAQTAFTQAQRDAVQTALAARTQALSSSARVSFLRSALDSAQRVADAELAGYRLGAVTSTDLILAQTQLATARTALAAATVQAAQASATLQLQIGALNP